MDPIQHASNEFNKKSKKLYKLIEKQIEDDRKNGIHSEHAEKTTDIIIDYLDSVDTLLNELSHELQQLKNQ